MNLEDLSTNFRDAFPWRCPLCREADNHVANSVREHLMERHGWSPWDLEQVRFGEILFVGSKLAKIK